MFGVQFELQALIPTKKNVSNFEMSHRSNGAQKAEQTSLLGQCFIFGAMYPSMSGLVRKHVAIHIVSGLSGKPTRSLRNSSSDEVEKREGDLNYPV